MKIPFAIIAFLLLAVPAFGQEQPNVVFIICDDLGYGDVQCLNPEHGKIKTPHVDQLATEGMVFTDAHSGSSVCTPTRYGLLTGRYSWRTKLQKGVVQGFSPCLIAEDRPTVAGFYRAQGYDTAIIGKWHLNFEYLDPQTGKRLKAKGKALPPVGATIPDGPVHRGFDYFHGIHHARSMEAIIENGEVIEHDPVENFLPRVAKKSVDYINSRKGKKKPFFLYVPLGSPHTPIVPTGRWVGMSGLGDYGDFVMQTDHAVGEISKALQAQGFSENTLVIFTSDNGCSKAADIKGLAEQGHRVSGEMRGSKADIWDGGHRVPFIVRWPGKVTPGSECSQLICLTDFFRTAVEVLGVKVPPGSCEDSVSFLPALLGNQIESKRAGVVHHSISGHFAYRSGDWKLLLARGSGGWSSPKEKEMGSDSEEAQLYNLAKDPKEQVNLYRRQPDVAKKLLDQLLSDVESGRSVQGAPSKNDVDKINLWKSKRANPGKTK
ncbi:MAG: arylsulfatase [Planctomycetaceae bacterium]|nr:arylsulfatase [Planctomycetaceae bacterium]